MTKDSVELAIAASKNIAFLVGIYGDPPDAQVFLGFEVKANNLKVHPDVADEAAQELVQNARAILAEQEKAGPKLILLTDQGPTPQVSVQHLVGTTADRQVEIGMAWHTNYLMFTPDEAVNFALMLETQARNARAGIHVSLNPSRR